MAKKVFSSVTDSDEKDKLNPNNITLTTIVSTKTIASDKEPHGTFMNTVKETGSMLSLNNRGFFASSANKVDQVGHSTEQKANLKHILSTTIKLFRNPVFVCILVATAIEGLLQNSTLAFTSLFLEYQYRLASGSASFSLGALSIPPLIFGSLLSGYLIKRFDWKMKQCLFFLATLLFCHLFAYSGFLANCKEPNFIFTKDYLAKKADTANMQQYFGCYADLNATTMCDCDKNIYKPVCMKDSFDIVFESACLAGCKSYNKNLNQYSNCSYAQCIFDRLAKINGTPSQPVSLVNGLCEAPVTCKNKLHTTYVTIFFIMLLTAMVYIPYMKVTIGCVASNPEMNAIALGLKQLAMTGIGTIPGPIIFGSVIDLSCKYWYADCLNQKVCKAYDNYKFSMSYGYLGIGFKLLCCTSVVMAIVFLKMNRKK
jgi:hypothetical protein